MNFSLLHGITAKFIMATALIVALFSASWGSRIIKEEKTHLMMQLEGYGRLLLTSLSAPIINTMILDEMGLDPGLLEHYIEEIMGHHNVPAVYAFITSGEGKVLAHSRSAEYGLRYKDKLTTEVLNQDGFRTTVVNDGKQNILDMAYPLRVEGKNWGALRVGFSLTGMEQEYEAFRMKVWLFSFLQFLVGTVIFYVMGTTMARPLKRLAKAMSNVDLGSFEQFQAVPRNDEIGLLQQSYSDMVLRLKKSEQERAKAQNYLIQNEKMATIGKIVAGVAHEINNPLAALSACVYNLEGKVLPEARNSMGILNGGIDRIQTIVSQLSDFNRAGTVDLNYVPSNDFFREAHAFAVMALKKYSCELRAEDLCQPPVLLHIDKGKIHQVILNLLLNAADASPPHGIVEVSATTDSRNYLVKVRDHGAGIPPEVMTQIFDIFFTTKPAGAGSGIGLAVCRSIVDLHHGSIEVESRPGETTFILKIPLEQDAAHA